MLIRILYYNNIYPIAIIATIQTVIQVHAFVNSAVIAPIVLKVEEDIIIESKVITLGLVISIGVTIIVIITIRRLPRGYLLASLFSLAKRVFTSFALR